MDKDGQKKKERYKLSKVEVRLKLTENGGLYSTEPITTPSAAVKVMSEAMAQLDREYVCVVNLNSQAQPINYNIVSIGTMDSAAASKSNIFKSAILSNASSIILLHCHPSGSLKPSMDDTKLTISLIQAGKIMDIKVLDHIICNQKGGTAKTTTAVNLGVGLADEGKKVLIIDMDPQASATICLGYPRPDFLEKTVADMMDKVILDEPIAPKEGILHHDEGVDLMPSNISLSGMEVSLVNAMSRESVLRQYLDTVKRDYD